MKIFQKIKARHKAKFDALTSVHIKRFASDPESAVALINNAIDRQISKASGLLTFNTVLFAGLQLDNQASLTKSIATVCALISSLALLSLFEVKLRRPDTYENAHIDFIEPSKLAYRRSIWMLAILYLSAAATWLAIFTVIPVSIK